MVKKIKYGKIRTWPTVLKWKLLKAQTIYTVCGAAKVELLEYLVSFHSVVCGPSINSSTRFIETLPPI